MLYSGRAKKLLVVVAVAALWGVLLLWKDNSPLTNNAGIPWPTASATLSTP